MKTRVIRWTCDDCGCVYEEMPRAGRDGYEHIYEGIPDFWSQTSISIASDGLPRRAITDRCAACTEAAGVSLPEPGTE